MSDPTRWWHRLRTRRKPAPPHSATPTPLTIRRISDILAHHGFAFRLDEDGDVTGLWDGHPFWFMLRGDSAEVLQVLGRWSVPLPQSARLSLLQAVNDWNRDHILPKAYIRTEGSSLMVYADHAVILQGGATDEQLSHTLLSSLVTTLRLFSALGGRASG